MLNTSIETGVASIVVAASWTPDGGPSFTVIVTVADAVSVPSVRT